MNQAKQSYAGGCHCGKVRYRVTLDLAAPAITCNCSICSKTGTMLSFVPEADFALESGDEALIDYQFNKKVIHHYFCKVCGIRSFARGVDPQGNPVAAINVRCLDGVDLDQVATHRYEGKDA